ncbi:ABC-2 family transporter protein [Myxococcota bacterium]|nr:ABC-2 family transporter protein [Myxococcota bacterium]
MPPLALPLLDAFRLGVVEALAFGSQIWMRLVTVPMAVAFQYAVYAAIYASGPDRIGDHSLPEIAGYVALVQTLRTLYANNISFFIGQAIRTGQIATFLLRPVSFPWFAIAYTSGRGASNLVTIGGPTLLAFGALGALPAPASAVHFAAFLALALAAFLVYNLVFTLAGLLGFYVEFSGEIGWSVELVAMLLGGATVPLTFFPEAVERFCRALPFATIYFVPVEAWLGKLPADRLLPAVGEAWLWVAVLAVAVQAMYARGRHHLSVQGG